MNNKILIPIIGVASFGLGFGVCKIIDISKKKEVKTYGNLRIDMSEPEEPPKLFLELECDPNWLMSANNINLKVTHKNFI